MKAVCPEVIGFLLLGGPGTGKTTFGVQYLYKGRTDLGRTECTLLLTNRPIPSRPTLRGTVGMFPKRKRQESSDLLTSPQLSGREGDTFVPPALQQSFLGASKFNIDNVVNAITEVKKKVGAKRCVIDSISALTLQYKDDFDIRQQTLRLIKELTEMDLTTIMLAENSEDRQDVTRFGAEAFLAQGVIVLHMYRVEESNVKALEVRKMRGAKHTDRLCPTG